MEQRASPIPISAAAARSSTPAEVADALLTSDAVADPAVVGIPHDALGEAPVAFVVPRGPGALDKEKVLAGAGTDSPLRHLTGCLSIRQPVQAAGLR